MQNQEIEERSSDEGDNDLEQRRSSKIRTSAENVIAWLQPRPVSKSMALVGISLLVISAFLAHGSSWSAWALAGAALSGGAIIFRLLWDTAAASNLDSGEADQFSTKFMESRPVSKSMLLVGTVLLMVAALIRYVDPSSVAWATVGWAGLILVLSAIILRFAWNS